MYIEFLVKTYFIFLKNKNLENSKLQKLKIFKCVKKNLQRRCLTKTKER